MGEELSGATLVLDSWPVLEWIKAREPASSRFRDVLQSCTADSVQLRMTRINYGGVIYSVRKAIDIPSREHSLQVFLGLPILVHSVSDELVDAAVELKSKYPFSYADAFAAALAIQLRAPVVTGDRDFRKLEKDGLLELKWVGA